MKLRIFTEPQQGASYAQLLAVAQRAEHLGFDAFFRSDHFLKMGDVNGAPGPSDAWTTLAGISRETSKIRLGTLVNSVTFRHPAITAVSVANVDAMSNGRVELGLGAGWYLAEHSSYGIPFPALGERFNVLTEHIAYVALKQYRLNNKVHEKTYKIMLAIMLMKNKSELYMSYLPDCESHMRDNNDNFNFIHYKNGFPPFFHKFMFSNSSLNYGDPFELLRVNPSTYASYYMHNLAGSYLNKIGKKLEPVLLI